MDKIYFRGLNGIRAIAVAVVISFHIDQFLRLFGLPSFGYHNTGMAGFAVTLFFVLSGYLITFLLLTEKNQFGKVDLLKFYKRRILRIWPIYYLLQLISIVLILIGALVVTDHKVVGNFLLYFFLLANFTSGNVLTLTPLWSVGVEEQFYLFWPVLLNASRNIVRSLLIIIFVYLAIKIGFRILENGNGYSIVYITAFDAMAIGGIMANFVFEKKRILKFFYHPALQIFSWLFLAISILYKPVHLASLFDSEIHAMVYSIIIVNVSTNPKTLINLENRVLNFIGRISYGMYVYHMLIIWVLSMMLKKHLPGLAGNKFLQYSCVYGLIYGVTIFVAYLSYRYFESYFLRLKLRFAKVQSSN